MRFYIKIHDLVYTEYLIRTLTNNFLLNFLNFGNLCIIKYMMCLINFFGAYCSSLIYQHDIYI